MEQRGRLSVGRPALSGRLVPCVPSRRVILIMYNDNIMLTPSSSSVTATVARTTPVTPAVRNQPWAKTARELKKKEEEDREEKRSKKKEERKKKEKRKKKHDGTY